MTRRLLSTLRILQHQNPLGLPRTIPPRSPPHPLPRARGLPIRRPIRNVAHTVAVSSAKGGVGKSTIAVNLALGFARLGWKTGILDADLQGPSIPTLMGLRAREGRVNDGGLLVPLTNYGVESMSMGYLVPQGEAVAWRGLMVMKALGQLLHEVEWGGLDVLVLDLPPGTGDTQLSITQQIVLDGAIIVSTPQDIALKDAVRGIELFRKVNVPILGMIQNMSLFTCPHCSHTTPIFGASGVERECKGRGIKLLGDIPLHRSICDDADRGVPTVVAEWGGERAEAFVGIAREVGGLIGLT